MVNTPPYKSSCWEEGKLIEAQAGTQAAGRARSCEVKKRTPRHSGGADRPPPSEERDLRLSACWTGVICRTEGRQKTTGAGNVTRDLQETRETNQNLIQEEIKRLNSGNACYHSVQNLSFITSRGPISRRRRLHCLQNSELTWPTYPAIQHFSTISTKK
jgi:hypothetical protein